MDFDLDCRLLQPDQSLIQPPVRSLEVTSAPIINTHLVKHWMEHTLAPIDSIL